MVHVEYHGQQETTPAVTRCTAGARPRLDEEVLHRIVVVGGGAAGLELATRLGERLACPLLIVPGVPTADPTGSDGPTGRLIASEELEKSVPVNRLTT